MENPTGTFQCVVCDQIWDGSEIRIDTAYTSPNRCADVCCDGPVIRLSYLPKAEYQKGKVE